MNKSKEKIKENPIVANRAIYMANPCHIIDKVVPLYWHNSYTNEKRGCLKMRRPFLCLQKKSGKS